MRRSGTLLLAAAASMACSLAGAADLEVLPAEPVIYVPTYFQWGGIYVGGYLGGGWGTADWAEGSPITVGNTTFLFPSVNASMRGLLGGAQVGANYQAEAVVFGVEADLTGMNLKGHVTDVFGNQYRSTANWAATFTGRVGYTVDRLLAYGKIGMAVEQDSETEIDGSGNGKAGTATRYGWTAGAGLEYGFDKHWSAVVEYDYLGFLSQLINFNGPATARSAGSASTSTAPLLAPIIDSKR